MLRFWSRTKGTFILLAEIGSANLTKEQEEALSMHRMRILHSRCLAPTVTITVK